MHQHQPRRYGLKLAVRVRQRQRLRGLLLRAASLPLHLPAGLLAAIGTVESGRGGLGSMQRVAWPWSINAGGRGLYVPSKAAAVMTVRSLQAAGLRTIDVGCFQVDLFYHPEAFATLDAAFDPETNSRAAARILTQSRFGGGSGSCDRALSLGIGCARGTLPAAGTGGLAVGEGAQHGGCGGRASRLRGAAVAGRPAGQGGYCG